MLFDLPRKQIDGTDQFTIEFGPFLRIFPSYYRAPRPNYELEQNSVLAKAELSTSCSTNEIPDPAIAIRTYVAPFSADRSRIYRNLLWERPRHMQVAPHGWQVSNPGAPPGPATILAVAGPLGRARLASAALLLTADYVARAWQGGARCEGAVSAQCGEACCACG